MIIHESVVKEIRDSVAKVIGDVKGKPVQGVSRCVKGETGYMLFNMIAQQLPVHKVEGYPGLRVVEFQGALLVDRTETPYVDQTEELKMIEAVTKSLHMYVNHVSCCDVMERLVPLYKGKSAGLRQILDEINAHAFNTDKNNSYMVCNPPIEVDGKTVIGYIENSLGAKHCITEDWEYYCADATNIGMPWK